MRAASASLVCKRLSLEQLVCSEQVICGGAVSEQTSNPSSETFTAVCFYWQI